jgi:hypothetical protein
MIAGTLPPAPARASGRCGNGRFKRKLHGAVVGRRQLVGGVHQRIGEDDARREAPDAGDNVARQDRLLVVETQTVAQLQCPGQSVLLDGMALNHLGLRLPLGVDALERIEHEIGVVSRRPCPGNDRIQHRKIRDPDKDESFRAIRSAEARRRSNRKCRRRGGFKQIASSHSGFSPSLQNRGANFPEQRAQCGEQGTAVPAVSNTFAGKQPDPGLPLLLHLAMTKPRPRASVEQGPLRGAGRAVPGAKAEWLRRVDLTR